MEKLILTKQEYQQRVEGKLPFQHSLDLEQHEREGHFPKRKDCAVCQQADGPVNKHRTVEEENKGMHTLHVDLSGPHKAAENLKGQSVVYMLVAGSNPKHISNLCCYLGLLL